MFAQRHPQAPGMGLHKSWGGRGVGPVPTGGEEERFGPRPALPGHSHLSEPMSWIRVFSWMRVGAQPPSVRHWEVSVLSLPSALSFLGQEKKLSEVLLLLCPTCT